MRNIPPELRALILSAFGASTILSILATSKPARSALLWSSSPGGRWNNQAIQDGILCLSSCAPLPYQRHDNRIVPWVVSRSCNTASLRGLRRGEQYAVAPEYHQVLCEPDMQRSMGTDNLLSQLESVAEEAGIAATHVRHLVRAFENLELGFRRAIGKWEQRRNPTRGYCLRCYRTWSDYVAGHTTVFDFGKGCFPLCQLCWKRLTPEERLPYYYYLWLMWKELDPDFHEPEKWVQIENAVLLGL